MAVLPEPWKVRSVGLLLSRGGSAEVTNPTSPDVDMARPVSFLVLKLLSGKEILQVMLEVGLCLVNRVLRCVQVELIELLCSLQVFLTLSTLLSLPYRVPLLNIFPDFAAVSLSFCGYQSLFSDNAGYRAEDVIRQGHTKCEHEGLKSCHKGENTQMTM
jgi:hypothetical protein